MEKVRFGEIEGREVSLYILKNDNLEVTLSDYGATIIRVRLDGIVQEERQMNAVTLFLTTYFVLILVATLTSTLFGLDLLTAFSSSVAFIGNVGPGFGEVVSFDNYAAMPSLLKIQGSVLMLMGRLEIFGFIQLLFIRSWR